MQEGIILDKYTSDLARFLSTESILAIQEVLAIQEDSLVGAGIVLCLLL